LLEHPNPDARLAVLTPCVRGAKPGEEFYRALSQQIPKENDVRVKSIAVLVLALSKNPIYINVVSDCLKKDESPVVRRRAAIALKQFAGNSEVEEMLKKELKREGDFRVKTQLTNSLGAFSNEKNLGVFKNLANDSSEFVRLAAAKVLIVKFNSNKGVETMIKLLKWNNEIMVSEDVMQNLSLVTGKSYVAYNDWNAWWKKEGSSFNVKQSLDVSQTISKADNLHSNNKNPEAINILEESFKNNPGHDILRSRLAMYLNDEAWSYAKSGKDFDKGLELAKRCVEIVPNNPAFLDTLSGLFFLTKNKDEAIKIIQKAIEIAPEGQKGLYIKRLKDYQTGIFVVE
jgi:tetratricopeptide (TPR) repeat protein